MAIFEEKAYGVTCDVCKEIYMNEHSGFSLWVDENSAKEKAQEDGWLFEGERCYCPNCYEIDEDDNVIIMDKND